MQGSGGGDGLSGQTIGGRYQLRTLLGRGGFAEVFRAWDNLDDIEVAFKVLKVPGHLSEAAQREFVARFHEEAKLTRKMFKGMPHVRQVLDMGVAELAGLPQPWMAMELLEGETLHEWLRRRRGSPTRLPPREALALLRPVLEATAFAHERGVAHRDLKPANIFLSRGPSGGGPIVKVLDFGIAKVLQGDEEASGNTMTSSTMQMFSPQYGAPEQFAAKKTGKYTDVFALGLIMTELCTDRAPLSEDGDRTECMMASLDKRERPSPRSASVEVGAAARRRAEGGRAPRRRGRAPSRALGGRGRRGDAAERGDRGERAAHHAACRHAACRHAACRHAACRHARGDRARGRDELLGDRARVRSAHRHQARAPRAAPRGGPWRRGARARGRPRRRAARRPP
ncbi:MAG TPA: serine/threonine-protein kinase, partial [Polyangiaceae bacterium]|nr:serine/threonine-protein kinase [Polyangiaceae bacterium]